MGGIEKKVQLKIFEQNDLSGIKPPKEKKVSGNNLTEERKRELDIGGPAQAFFNKGIKKSTGENTFKINKKI